MLRIVAHTSGAAARKYYAEGLKREDYYAAEQEVAGKWHGRAAKRLGLAGDVGRGQFGALVDNLHPVTGEKLTPRTKEGRRVGYDFTYNAPKSLSVLYALTQDERVLSAFRQAVADTMAELEDHVETRVRQKGAQSSRITGNLAWAEFVHFTARPVGGLPDPHLHIHAFTFNATYDESEARWKAADFAAIKRQAHYFEAGFHSRLAGSLAAAGYGIQRTAKGWEIAGVPKGVIAKFSQRTAQIESLAKVKGITDARLKDALGAKSREGKRQGTAFRELRREWISRLSAEEKQLLAEAFRPKAVSGSAKLSPREAVDYALARHFERNSVMERGRLLAEAMRYAVGDTSPQQIRDEFGRRGLIGRKIGDEHLCTTVEVLAEEIALLGFVRSGRNSCAPLGGKGGTAAPAHLSTEQRLAMEHLLNSRDQVMAVRGVAGAGKTTMMQPAVEAIEARGMRVFAFAPSAEASRGTLREAGFAGADTLARLLTDQRLQRQVRGQVIWIDEAGLVGTRELWRVMEIAGPSTRVILTGDAAQHAPVARGDAFRLLQSCAGLRIAEITEIRRQEVQDYKEAVAALSKGDLKLGFRRLDALGAFIEIEDAAERYRELAADYLALGKQGTAPLVVSPTHREIAEVTRALRTARRGAGQLGMERTVRQYHDLGWEEAARALPENYTPGLMVQFHQNARGIRRSEQFRIVESNEKGAVRMRSAAGEIKTLPLKEASKFLVYEERELPLAAGDLVRITRNGASADGRRLNNGNVFAVKKFTAAGEIVLGNGAKLAADHGHLAHGYCRTSHASQSRSVRDVLVAQSSDSFVAGSREQFYVSCSRGKQTIRIYTDNRAGLQEAVGNSSARMSGMELAGLGRKDIDAFMKAMGEKQWREAVRSRQGADGAKTFLHNVLDQRRMDPKKDGALSWKGYIEMRRNLAGADGKNRSKGYPSAVKKAGRQEGRSWPKISLHTAPVEKQLKAAHEAKKQEAKEREMKKPGVKAEQKPEDKRTVRTMKGYQSAAAHFRKYADKVKGRPKPAAPGAKQDGQPAKAARKPMPQATPQQAAEHKRRESRQPQKTPAAVKTKSPRVIPAGPKK